MPVPEATYDITTLVGQTRFHAADTNVTNGSYVWTDAELQYCLQLAANVPELAAARALRAAAADAAKISVVTRIGLVTNDETGVSAALHALAQALEEQVIAGGAISSPDEVFSTASGGGAVPGSMDSW